MDDAFAVVLPYFNEAAFLRPTLESLLAQSRPARQFILIDNGSTDGSSGVCRQVMRRCGSNVVYLSESRPGKTFALERGQPHISTPLVAFCDADTFYPPHYLEQAARLFGEFGNACVGLLAKDLAGSANSLVSRWQRRITPWLGKKLSWQALAGGCGQLFRTDAFRQAGGYSSAQWPYTLEDHEFMQRLSKVGRFRYHRDLWCQPANRRRDRRHVQWNRFEQLVYFCTPARRGDWFFHQFLAKRFERRHIFQANLRKQDWNHPAPIKVDGGGAFAEWAGKTLPSGQAACTIASRDS